MNSKRVVIENAFGSLKTRWKILKHFNSRVDRATKVTMVCCVLHNYCELCGEPEPKVANPATRGDVLMGFCVERLSCVRKGKAANAKGERIRQNLFEQWVIDHLI
jgi:hypothetical protein